MDQRVTHAEIIQYMSTHPSPPMNSERIAEVIAWNRIDERYHQLWAWQGTFPHIVANSHDPSQNGYIVRFVELPAVPEIPASDHRHFQEIRVTVHDLHLVQQANPQAFLSDIEAATRCAWDHFGSAYPNWRLESQTEQSQGGYIFRFERVEPVIRPNDQVTIDREAGQVSVNGLAIHPSEYQISPGGTVTFNESARGDDNFRSIVVTAREIRENSYGRDSEDAAVMYAWTHIPEPERHLWNVVRRVPMRYGAGFIVEFQRETPDVVRQSEIPHPAAYRELVVSETDAAYFQQMNAHLFLSIEQAAERYAWQSIPLAERTLWTLAIRGNRTRDGFLFRFEHVLAGIAATDVPEVPRAMIADLTVLTNAGFSDKFLVSSIAGKFIAGGVQRVEYKAMMLLKRFTRCPVEILRCSYSAESDQYVVEWRPSPKSSASMTIKKLKPTLKITDEVPRAERDDLLPEEN